MPQIAQQEYLRIVGKTVFDAEIYARVAKAIQAGTIFDAVIEFENGDGEKEIVRPLSMDNDNIIFYFDTYNGENTSLSILFSPENYEAIAAVQRGGYGYDTLPTISKADMSVGGNIVNLLFEDNQQGYIICGGKCIIIEKNDIKQIISIKTSNIDPPSVETVFEIQESDLPNFIGLKLA